MKQFNNLTLVLIFSLLPFYLFSQAGGNVIYEENNRYKQNDNYNEDAELIWNARSDNSLNYIVRQPQADNEMIFTVNSLMNVKADSYLAIFNIVQAGKTAKEINSIVNSKIAGFKEEIKSSGISEQDIFTDMISLVPVYNYEVEKKLFSKTYTEVPQGFEMQKNVHLKFTDESKLDNIMTAAANNEIYDLIKVEYFVENNDKIYTELREKSIEYMNLKLESFKKLNIQFDTIYHIISEKSAVVYPIDRYRSYQAFTGTSIEAIKSKNVTKVRKPMTMFYNKLPYHNYDIVINPAILEPVIQFTYSIIVKYVIKDPIKKTEKQFILVTPEGVVRTLKID
jgi:uncharacterized protein YggE